MLNPEVWVTGGTTMAVGMGIVFSFLVVMVFAMLIMSNIVAWLNKVCPLPVAEVKTTKKVTSRSVDKTEKVSNASKKAIWTKSSLGAFIKIASARTLQSSFI